jgi:hypothetical protein
MENWYKNYKFALSKIDHHVFAELEKFVLDVYKQFKLEGIKSFPPRMYYKYTKNEAHRDFPERDFHVDFSDTNYDFLNTLPKGFLKVKVSFYYDEGNSALGFYQEDHLRIKINAPSVVSIVSTLEHEFVHYMQDLISIYVYGERGKMAGVSPRSVLDHSLMSHGHPKKPKEVEYHFYAQVDGGYDSVVDKHGDDVKVLAKTEEEAMEVLKDAYKIGQLFYQGLDYEVAEKGRDQIFSFDEIKPHTHAERRVEHTRRPIEHYTNLNSILNRLRGAYVSRNIERPGSEMSKREFFDRCLRGDVGQILEHSYAILMSVKHHNQKLYNFYINKLYRGFFEDFDETRYRNLSSVQKEIDGDDNDFESLMRNVTEEESKRFLDLMFGNDDGWDEDDK